jgi:hypothetical protein
MPQVLTITSSSGSQTVDIPLYDPVMVRQARSRFRREAIPELAYANALYMPGGRWPARGWVLVRRDDYFGIGQYGAVSLQIDDFKNGPLIFKNLAIVQARCVSRGLAQDADSIYLVELTDQRGLLKNRWFEFPTNSQYNARAPAYPETFYATTLTAGVAWTWSQMVGDLWAQMGTFLGAYPGLPSAPAGTPENFIFPGVCAWDALNQILDLLGMMVSVDLRQPAPYGIVVEGAADDAFDALTTKYTSNLEDDFDFIDTGSGRVPKQVVVYFHRRNQFYGTEETVRRDGLQWSTSALYSVTVAAPAQFALAVGVDYLWDDFSVRFDIDNNPMAADVATAIAIATERAQQYYNKIYRGTAGYMRRVYTGALPFVVGSQVDGVRWYMDYSQGRGAWRTEIMRTSEGPWPEVGGNA